MFGLAVIAGGGYALYRLVRAEIENLSAGTGTPQNQPKPISSVLALDAATLQAEIDRAAAGVELVKIDLGPAGFDLTMEAPEGTQVEHRLGQALVTRGNRFRIKIAAGKGELEQKRQTLANKPVFVNDKDLVFAQHTLEHLPHCEFGQRVVLGYLEYYAGNDDSVGGRLVHHSRDDALLMLCCIRTLALKSPLPADPVAALRQLRARLTSDKQGHVTAVRLDRQCTDTTLILLQKLPELRTLDLRETQITDDGLAHLAGLTGLKELNLSGTALSDAGLRHLANLTELEVLDLSAYPGSAVKLKGPGLIHLAGLKKLRKLDLSHSSVDDAALAPLAQLPALQDLALERAPLKGPGLAHLKGLAELRRLSLSGAALTDARLEHVKGLNRLEELDLGETSIFGEGLVHLEGLPRLRVLILDRSKITSLGLEHLKGLTNLEVLSLRQTQITDAAAIHLRGLSQLRKLYLDETQITEARVEILREDLPMTEITRKEMIRKER
jgi:Leucine-rich repeat (LRR) protein